VDRESIRVYDKSRENGVPDEDEADYYSDQIRSIVFVGHLRQNTHNRRHLCQDLLSKGRLRFGHMHRDYFYQYTDLPQHLLVLLQLTVKTKNIDASYVGTREFLSRRK
jgi:hypothetical protein